MSCSTVNGAGNGDIAASGIIMCREGLIVSRIGKTTVKAKESISIAVVSPSAPYMTPTCSAANRMNTDTIVKFCCMAIVPWIRERT